MEILEGVNIQKFATYFRTYKNIWKFKLDVEEYHDRFTSSQWKALDLDEVKSKLETFLEEAEQIKKYISKESSEDNYRIDYTD